ncbi:MAG: OmpH family outer membrane protein [Pseudomonadota bacterium]
MSSFVRISDVPRWAASACLGLVLALSHVPAAPAQETGVYQSAIVLIDPERLFEQTKLGRSIAQRVQQEREALIAMNRRLEAELEAEEQALTEKREQSSPEEFRLLADAFDEKVQQIRRDSERRARDLERNRERAPRDFLRQVEPILIDVMRDSGAVAVLDQRSVLLSADIVDVTELAIARIDLAFDAGVSGGLQTQTPPDDEAPDTAE